MSAGLGSVKNAIEREAADWVLRLDENPACAADCDAWRALSPAHDEAFRGAHLLFERAPGLDALVPGWREEADGHHGVVARVSHWARRGSGRFVLPIGLAASIAALVFVPSQIQRPPSIATGIAQTRAVGLSDGTRVTLGARSGMDVRFDGARREVVLARGQAFFEVAHDPARPFSVIAGDVEVRVTGTRFDVRWVGDKVDVAVLDGRVELRRRGLLSVGDKAPDRVLTAGRHVALVPDAGFAAASASATTPGEWRTGRLFYSEAPLDEIVADVQRYSARPIRVNPAIAGLRVTTSFRADNVEQFLRNVEATLPVRATADGQGGVVLEPR